VPQKTLGILQRDLCINKNNHQKPTFHPLGDFLNPALALLGQGLKKSPIGQKLDFVNHSYLCKGLVVIEVLLLSTLYGLVRLVFSTKSIIM
jgi:hypothetical protein